MSQKERGTSLIFKQLSLWQRLALSLPYTLLSFIIFLVAFDFTTLLDKIIVVAGSIAITIAVTWWWWVMHTINHFTNIMNNAAGNLEDFKQELEAIKKNL